MPSPVTVFISKIDADYQIAKRLKGKLERQNVEVFISEDTPLGKDWHEEIESKLRESDVFILIYRGPESVYTWCIYEVGLFTSLNEKVSRKPIICIHAPGVEPPRQLRRLQSVRGDIAGVKGFLEDFFGTNNIIDSGDPLSPGYVRNEVEVITDAEYISDSINPHSNNEDDDHIYYNRKIELTFNISDFEKRTIPLDAIVDAGSLTFEIFDLGSKPMTGKRWTWGDIVSQMTENGQTDWIEKINVSVSRACEGKGVPAVDSSVTSLTSGKKYIPSLHMIQKNTYEEDEESENMSVKSITAQIVFVHTKSDGNSQLNTTQPFAS